MRLTIVLWAAGLAAGGPLLQKAAGFLRWLCMAGFKALLTVFTMYITMSGVMSAGADAAAAKAARVTISGVVPVLGSILSDASDTLLAGARALKNGVGVMGMIGAVAVCLLVWLLARTGLWLTPEVLEQTRLAGAIAGWLGLAAPVSL